MGRCNVRVQVSNVLKEIDNAPAQVVNAQPEKNMLPHKKIMFNVPSVNIL